MNIDPHVVVVWGDSIAESGWPQMMEFSFNCALNTGRPIKVINKGVAGLPAATARNQFDETILPDKPDVVIIQFGLNDLRHDGSRGELPISALGEFENHLTAMVRMCVDRLSAAVILFGNHKTRVIVTMPTGLTYEETRVEYNKGIRRVAESTGVRYCDMEKKILDSGISWDRVVCEDGVHLSPMGKHVYAQIAANELVGIMGNGTSREEK